MSDEIINNWNNAAKLYAEAQTESRYSRFCESFISDYFSDVKNLKILDAGCGSGIFTDILSQNGGDVIGCDGSAEMVKLAKVNYPSLRFDSVNLMETLPYCDEEFDIVFCNLVLMDIDPIDGVISEIHRITKKNGKFFFSIVHPAFYTGVWERDTSDAVVSKKITGYITEFALEQNFWGLTIHYHRPISYYFNKIADRGFSLTKMIEPKVYDEAKIPDIPLYLFAEFQKHQNTNSV
jgi:Methylase involved in ubiquinone/menaquinone biosynthesis